MMIIIIVIDVMMVIINYFLDIFEIIFMFLGRSGHGTDYHHKQEYSGM